MLTIDGIVNLKYLQTITYIVNGDWMKRDHLKCLENRNILREKLCLNNNYFRAEFFNLWRLS